MAGNDISKETSSSEALSKRLIELLFSRERTEREIIEIYIRISKLKKAYARKISETISKV
ncbi:MAG: hypothetical protein F6K11_20215 [Leptolyngbya sp. SIO3F4]|nr:hypothetical protein [Leptolyngbya sp. SIO3F4]